MRGRSAAIFGSAIAVLLVAVTGCGGGGGGGGGKVSGTTLTIYSSLPLQGAAGTQAEAIANAAKLAVADMGGKVGKYKIRYISLDDSTAAAGISMDAIKKSQPQIWLDLIGDSCHAAHGFDYWK